MITKLLKDITTQDINDLITNKVPESKTLEYKEELPGPTDTDKKECTADTTALANTQGGDLLYGITEERDANGKPTGIPKDAPGLPITNPDKELLRLTTLIRDTSDPRLTNLQTTVLTGFRLGPIILLRIPNSWNKPHMVTTNGRFYARSTNGKYPMDTNELRDAFLQADLTTKIRTLRTERTTLITTGNTPIPLPIGPKTILHLIPLQALRLGQRVDIRNLENRTLELPPFNKDYTGWDHRYNLDGFLTFAQPPKEGRYVHANLPRRDHRTRRQHFDRTRQ